MIRGFFDVGYPTPVPKIWIGLALPGITAEWIAVDFVVDTGASVTCLHPLDAIERVGLSGSRLREMTADFPTDRSISGITGLAEYLIVPAQYLLVHEGQAAQTIDGLIRVARPVPGNERIPSLLGWDILAQFRITLDRRTGEVLLQ